MIGLFPWEEEREEVSGEEEDARKMCPFRSLVIDMSFVLLLSLSFVSFLLGRMGRRGSGDMIY